MSAYDIDDARSCAESLYMTRTVAAVDAVAGSAVVRARPVRRRAERMRLTVCTVCPPKIAHRTVALGTPTG